MGDVRVRKKLLIVGGNGFVGGTVAKLSRTSFETVVAGRTQAPGFEEFIFYPIDITRADEVRAALEAIRPDAVVNAAAMSGIDHSETHKNLAYGINVEGARNVAQASFALGCRHLFISTDAVFDGKREAYCEEDQPSPVNYYGQTKWEAEKAVLGAHPRSAVLRISLVLGFPVGAGNSFLSMLKSSLAGGKALSCPVDEVRTPIDVLTLAESILEVVQSDFEGILHVGATQSIDRYTLTRKASALLGYGESTELCKPASGEAPGRAPRHKNGILNVTRARATLKTGMLGIDETLRRAIESENFFKRTNHENT